MKTKQNNPTRIYREVSVEERLPKKSGHYIGVWVNDILTPTYFDNQIGFSEGILHWLELVELPSEEEMYNQATTVECKEDEELDAFRDGASFILNYIKGIGNEQ